MRIIVSVHEQKAFFSEQANLPADCADGLISLIWISCGAENYRRLLHFCSGLLLINQFLVSSRAISSYAVITLFFSARFVSVATSLWVCLSGRNDALDSSIKAYICIYSGAGCAAVPGICKFDHVLYFTLN